MKRVIISLSIAIITLFSFSSQLLALPEGAIARLGIGSVNAVTFSPDGKYLAVASSIGVVLIDPFNLTVIHTFDTKANTTSTAFSLDGRILASVSDDSTIKLWDMKSLKEMATLGEPLDAGWDIVWSVTLSPDGAIIARGSGDNGTIKLWDVKSLKEIATLEGHLSGVNAFVGSVAFSPDGSMLTSSGGDHNTIMGYEALYLRKDSSGA